MSRATGALHRMCARVARQALAEAPDTPHCAARSVTEFTNSVNCCQAVSGPGFHARLNSGMGAASADMLCVYTNLK